LLSVIVGKDRAFIGDAVDIGRAVAHHAAVVGADVPIADVVGHDHENVRRLLWLRGCSQRGQHDRERRQSEEGATEPACNNESLHSL
jgi:hypothetical protein